jgi:hypothetical protein
MELRTVCACKILYMTGSVVATSAGPFACVSGSLVIPGFVFACSCLFTHFAKNATRGFPGSGTWRFASSWHAESEVFLAN